MKMLALKLTRIGNSKGVRLPAALIKRYGFSGFLAVEARDDGLLLKPKKPAKLSWEETAREMAVTNEDWTEWDSAASDGLESCPWVEPAPASVRAWARASAEHERRVRKPNGKPAKR